MNASQPANQSAREGKCVRVWGPESVFLCVSVSVCATKRDREREREREGGSRSLCWWRRNQAAGAAAF